MKRTILSVVCIAVALIALATSLSQAMQDGAKQEKLKSSQLPPAVAQAIKRNCTGCSIGKATREVENGVTVYDIEFKHRQGEIAVAEDGSIIDRETVVQLREVPTAALEAIQKAASGGKIRQIAKGEIHAELKEGKIVKLGSPRYIYEAELVNGNRVAEIEVSPEGQVIEPAEWRKGVTKKTEMRLIHPLSEFNQPGALDRLSRKVFLQ